MATAVLIPFASTEPHRLAALAYVQSWYADRFPQWSQVVASDGGLREGWSKGTAVARAVAMTDADVLVIADADCICDAVGEAVEQVQSGHAKWASPHVTIRRLSEEGTAAVLNGATASPDLPAACKAYSGVPGGGITVIGRDSWERCSIDPRFLTTHGEDTSWACALRVTVGKPWRGKLPLFHLWHPPTPPMGSRFHANRALAMRYQRAERQAYRDRSTAHIDQLLTEAREWRPMPVPERHDSGGIVAIIVPVMLRPHRAAPFMASIRASGIADGVYAVADPQDTATVAAWEAEGATVLISDRGVRFGAKVNVGLERTSEPWLFLVGDDVAFGDGWLLAALDAAGDRYDMVSTNDGARTDLHRLAVHPLVRRTYIEELGGSFDGPGLMAHEGYGHWCVDLEWSALAIERGRFTYAPGALVEHLHPLWGKGDDDEVYAIARGHAMKDRRTFAARHRAYQVRTRKPRPRPADRRKAADA